MEIKPVVTYDLDDFVWIFENRCAVVFPIDHPNCSNKNPVMTSTVISIKGTEFETINTRYVGVHRDVPKEEKEKEEPLDIPEFLRSGSD